MDRFQVTPSLAEFFIDSGKTATLTNIGTATIYGAPDAMFPNVAAAAWSLAPGATRVEDYGTLWVRTADGVSSTLTVDPIATGTATDIGTGQGSALGSGGSSSGVILPWAAATSYITGQPVTNGGRTYTANDNHTSGATFAGDVATHWSLLPTASGATLDGTILDETQTLGTAYLPSNLTMRQVASQRLFDWPIHQKSVGLIAWEPMVGADLTRWGKFNRSGTPTTTVNADGSVTVTAGGATAAVDFVSGSRPLVLGMATEVTIKAGFALADIAGVEVGLFKEDDTASVWAYFNGTGFGISTLGTATSSAASPAQPTAFTVDTTQDLTVGAYITEPTMIAYVRQGDKTAYVTKSGFTLDGTAANNRKASTLRDWRLGFALSPAATKSLTVTRFAAAYMPGDSFSNPKTVTYKDGTPYTRDGKYFFTGTVHTAGSFTDHSSALFCFDPDSYRATLIAHLFVTIGTDVLHNGPGQLLYDQDTKLWNWLVGTWGPTAGTASGVDIALATTSRDLPVGGVFMLNATVLTGFGTGKSYYDPCARWDGTKWRVGAVETTSRTAWTGNHACYLEGTSLTALSLIRSDTTHDNYQDGAQWAKVGGVWYLIYGGMTGFVSFDQSLTAASYTALPSWSANSPAALWNSFGSYMSHAAVFMVNDDLPRTRYLALCYGADVMGPTSLRGSLIILEADEKPTGWEVPRRRIVVAR